MSEREHARAIEEADERAPMLAEQAAGGTAGYGTGRTSQETLPELPASQLSIPQRFALFLLFVVLLPLSYVYTTMPAPDVLQKYVADITELEVRRVSFQGWAEAPPGMAGAAQGNSGKWMAFGVNVSMAVDYEKETTVPVTANQRSLLRLMGNDILGDICVSLNEGAVYTHNAAGEVVPLVTVADRQPVCVSLLDGEVTDILTQVYVRPNLTNMVWLVGELQRNRKWQPQLLSNLSVSTRKLFFEDLYLPVRDFHVAGTSVDEYVDWQKLRRMLRHGGAIFETITRNSTILELAVTDVPKDSALRLQASVRIPIVGQGMDQFILPEDIVFPATEWMVALPGCDGNGTIGLPNATIVVDPVKALKWEQQSSIDISMTAVVAGRLPDPLLYEVCEYDNGNVVTPMSLIFRKMFDPAQLVELTVKGRRALESDDLETIPVEVVTELVAATKLPLAFNFTVSQSDMIEDLSIQRLKLRLRRNRHGEKVLHVAGKVRILFNPPFYNVTEDSSVSITAVKGVIDLYHHNVRFASTPLRTWLPCDTAIDGGRLEVSLELDQDEVDIIDPVQLSVCLNEIIFNGQTEIYIDGKVDILTKTVLGELVLFDMPAHGKTVVKKDDDVLLINQLDTV
ncbi:AFR122Cp [Eremothecium gossypii ATCC 10895]|uniref:AFR122Cp n=1 Tax=Eremothecium gossypii (strain ATCC 10895 / CBS 109.51 / FGSC 9923 / NRRL Y-1056) TaxID=284811 RepID=Q754E8_EREGS|nr:AFR122Cp [Eremothecium gossypii ATCC 10895]AAS53493.1 AFR122Cp [Eremothecium gossypii ATCC 10895]AEY97805.1 FAFR122Cp [Eremothecium gossypii FDAG1]